MSDTVTILGATGYTGRICVAEAIRAGLGVRLAGRSGDRLRALAAEHADAGVPIDTTVVDVHDRAALTDLCASSDVLLTTVGPYARLGHGTVEAAIETGSRYVDVTGEVEFLSWVHGQHERARDSGAVLAPAVGFDGVPGDLLAVQAARALGRPVQTMRVAYHIDGVRVSAGTARTALGAVARGGAVWRNGRVAQEPAGIHQWQVPFPSPPGPTSAVSAPLPEVVTVARSVGAAVARSYFVVPAADIVSTVAGPAQRLSTVLAGTPLWDLLERAVDRMPAGPSPAQRQATRAVVLAESAASDGVSAVRWARVDDMYGATGVTAVAAARRLLAGDVQPGVLTPSQIFDADELFEALAAQTGPVA